MLQHKSQVLLLSVPLMEIKRPAPAIYHLKGQLIAGDVSCTAIDANILLYNAVGPEAWGKVQNGLNFEAELKSVPLDVIKILETDLVDIIKTQIEQVDPDWIGISVFSVNSRIATTIILQNIRRVYPDKKIVVGGMGLGVTIGSKEYEYAEELQQQGLIDYYIAGEGEVALVELICKNNPDYPGVNSTPRQIGDLEGLAFADYNDCDHDLYPFKDYDYGRPVYVLTGSRGCVRRCDFCDVYKLWPKFKTRGGEHIAQEMIHHYETRGVDNFYFSDSLVNGSMKAFRETSEIIYKYKQDHNVDFIWGGQFICRTNGQMGPEDYELAHASGLRNTGIGLEHASERMRMAMRKGFSDQALEDTLRNHQKYGINTMLNILFGHPVETLNDHHMNLEFLDKYQDLMDDGTIASLNLQTYIAFLPGTDFADKFENYTVQDTNIPTEKTKNKKIPLFWKSKIVDTLDFPEIYRRRKEVSDACAEKNWRTVNERVFMQKMETELLLYSRWKAENKIKLR
jgi:radical SAM superfamily enzyme YgiQ (UPF0313 family)